MNIDAFAASDRGRQRDSNEDHYLIDQSLGLYVVCDGMGGHAAGEVAAERSVSFAAEFIRDRRDVLEKAHVSPDGYFRVLELAESATQEASRRLYDLACSHSAYAGMGTTMTLLLVVNNKAVMAHVGDSRLYMLRRGTLHQLSTDHTLGNELVQSGGLSREEAEDSKFNHVLTRTIGHQRSVQVESLLFDLIPGDTCLLCSDGLSNYFDDRAIVTQYLHADDLSELPMQFIEFANSQGGADNITLILLRALADAEMADSADTQQRIDVLKSTFLCHQFAVNWLMRVLNIAAIIECAEGNQLLSAGQACDGLYIVLEGRLTIEDDMLPFGALLPSDCVGESSLLYAGKVDASVVADEPSRLIFISRKQFGKLTRRLPKLGNALLRNLGQHLSEQLVHVRSLDDHDSGDTDTWKREPD
jgi:serine/threonine protein phosphatase PrpC